MLNTYEFKLIHGRVKIYINGLLHIAFNQSEFKGVYSYRDDIDRYGIDFFVDNTVIEVWYETIQMWEEILKLIDKNL